MGGCQNCEVGGWWGLGEEGDSDADNKAQENKTKMSFIIHVCMHLVLCIFTHV